MVRRTLLLAALLPLTVAAGKPYAAQLNVARCRALPAATAATLGSDWAAMSRFIERCAVPGPDGRVALTVDVVRIDRAYAADFFASHPDQQVPLPVIRDAKGTPVGSLGEGFPEDPPGRLRVTFARWQGNWPHEIRLYQAGESALAPHPLPPMRWEARSRMFVNTD